MSDAAIAQSATASAGVVEYASTIQLQLPDILLNQGGLPPSIPRELRMVRRLRFDDAKALSDDVATRSAGTMLSPSTLFMNLDSLKSLRQSEIDGKLYLVERPILPIDWTVTPEESEYLGYPMFKATSVMNGRAIEAWFTPSIPVPLGPDPYHGLPGLILVVTENDGERVTRATSVRLGPLDEAIIPPTRGERVEADEYQRRSDAYSEAAQRALREDLEKDD